MTFSGGFPRTETKPAKRPLGFWLRTSPVHLSAGSRLAWHVTGPATRTPRIPHKSAMLGGDLTGDT